MCASGHGLLTTDCVPAHDLQQARVIGEAELLGRLRDVPLVALQSGHDDASLGLGFEGVKARGRGARTRFARDAPRSVPDLGWYVIQPDQVRLDRKSTRLNSSHTVISYAVFCLKKKKKQTQTQRLRHHSAHVTAA